MRKTLMSVSISMLFAVIFAYAGPAIVLIGDKQYTESDLMTIQKSADEDPMIAVEKIKRGAGLQNLAKKHIISDKNSESEIYLKFFGIALQDDKIKSSTYDLPLEIQQSASKRLNVFEDYLAQYSDETVPVKVLDQQAFWKLVQKTRSYQIRKEAGVEPSMQNWQYTRGELIVAPSISVAKANGKDFVTGKDLNAYINANYDSFRPSATRGQKIEQVRSQLALDMVKGKLLEKKIASGEIVINAMDIDRAKERFIRKSMFKGDMDLKSIAGNDEKDIREKLYKKTIKDNQLAVDHLTKVLKGERGQTSATMDEELVVLETANDAMLNKLTALIADNNAYDWMRKNAFRGALHEAKQVMASQSQEEILNKEIAEQKIEIASIPE